MAGSILPRLASQLGRKDEEPNKQLGIELVQAEDLVGIREAAENLSDPDRKIQADCLAVLEQVGQAAPDLISDYLEEHLPLAFGSDNRLVWGSLINIALIADKVPEPILERMEALLKIYDSGGVIARDNVIKILARAGSASPQQQDLVFQHLIDLLNTCRPKSIPQYAESMLPVIHPGNQASYLEILINRLSELTPAQEKRVRKILRGYDKDPG